MSSNTFFSICQNNQETQKESTKVEVYNCCIDTCTKNSATPDICYSMCAQIFPGIKDQCALEHKCWNDKNGEFQKDCLRTQREPIQQCCKKKCEFKHNRFSKFDFDCTTYCAQYQLDGIL